MENLQHNRFKDAPWYNPEEESYILIGGAGGIGSWTTMLLARAGFKPIVYDFDLIEGHNIGGQLFPKSAIGKTKVEALTLLCLEYAGAEILSVNGKIEADSPTSKFVVSAFDNMLARKQMYASWIKEYGDDPEAIFIDGRLNAEQMQIYCIKGGVEFENEQLDYQQNHLFDDKEVEEAPCTLKQTSHSAAMIASHIVAFFTNHYTNVREKDNTRTTNFKWEYFIPMDLLTINQ
jgi:hypothetical protein